MSGGVPYFPGTVATRGTGTQHSFTEAISRMAVSRSQPWTKEGGVDDGIRAGMAPRVGYVIGGWGGGKSKFDQLASVDVEVRPTQVGQC